jgi:hypothetical protein
VSAVKSESNIGHGMMRTSYTITIFRMKQKLLIRPLSLTIALVTGFLFGGLSMLIQYVLLEF